MNTNLQNEVEVRPVENVDEENMIINQFNAAYGTEIG